MMYNSKLVASIKANGKVLREFKDTVYIPFGSEYSILLKNLNTVRALINIYIDGDNIVPGGLVLNAGQEIDLQRAIRNGNMNEGNKFKFIERTGKIEDHRGVKIEDGLIRVEFQFEKVYKRQDGIQWNHTLIGGRDYSPTWTVNNSVLRSSGQVHDGVACSDLSYVATSMAVGSATINASSTTLQSFNAAPQTETGITVAGSKSEQKFSTVSNFTCEPEKNNIILKLLGETEDNKAIREPITVKAKPKCTTCGKQNKATAKFCSECGTALVIYA
jgi:SNF2 family DNA or RNA helicase